MKKIAMITGASAGIGLACAKELASKGWHLIVTGRRKARLQELSQQLEQLYQTETKILVFDIQDKMAVEKIFSSLEARWRSIELLINNAGLAAGLDVFNEALDEDWDTMINTNIKGLLYVTGKVSKIMVAAGKGHIINIGSVAGREVYPKGSVYCATKAAVDSITKGMRIDLLPHGIRVSQVSPGAVETEFSMVRFKGDKERAAKVYEGYQPLKPEDIAGVVGYIASLPLHINVNDILVMPTAQANASTFLRK